VPSHSLLSLFTAHLFITETASYQVTHKSNYYDIRQKKQSDFQCSKNRSRFTAHLDLNLWLPPCGDIVILSSCGDIVTLPQTAALVSRIGFCQKHLKSYWLQTTKWNCSYSLVSCYLFMITTFIMTNIFDVQTKK